MPKLPSFKEFSSTPTGGMPKKAKKKAVKPKPSGAPGMVLPPSVPPPAPPTPRATPKPRATRPAPAAAAPPAMPPMPQAKRPPIFGLGLGKKR